MVSSRLFAFLCLVCADAARIVSDSQNNFETKQQSQFGRSCENQHSRFRLRSNDLQDFVNSYTGSDDMSLTGRARAVMKASAVLRILRRSSDCPWVVAGNSDDIEAVGKVVRELLASNPCAPAALAELQLLDTDGEEGAAPLARAMTVLMSDTCEIEPQGQASDESNELVDDDETEELVQDGIEEMLESEDASTSLVEQADMQRAHSWAHVGKLLGAIMLGVLFSLGCGYAGAFIVGFVGAMFGILLVQIGAWRGHHFEFGGLLTLWTALVTGGVIGATGGAVLCGAGFYQAVNASGLLLDQ